MNNYNSLIWRKSTATLLASTCMQVQNLWCMFYTSMTIPSGY